MTWLFWSSQAAGEIPDNDDYYEELVDGEAYCDPPSPRKYKTFAEYEECNEDSQQIFRSRYGEGSRYADVFTAEQIQAIEDRMVLLAASMCMSEGGLADLPAN